MQNPWLVALTALLVAACSDNSALARGNASRDIPAAVPASLAKGVRLLRVARGLQRPVGLEFIPGDESANLYVVEQAGTIRRFDGKHVDSEILLDYRKKVSTGHSEQGLLGLAFHPEFLKSPRLYINYTDRRGSTRVVELRGRLETDGRLVIDASKPRELLVVKQPYRNHNGGYLEFGPDGRLYVGLGDGGAANDPKGAGQNPRKRLGKMLRINVDNENVEIVSLGLRNPWRFHFDHNGDLYIGDVGQDRWEEINVVSAKELKGANFGWNTLEGRHCFKRSSCKREGMVEPAIEYSHKTGCSVTGGVVYRGKRLPKLQGMYFYSDYCTAILRSLTWSKGRVSQHLDWKAQLDPNYRLANVAAFGVDKEGEMYILANESSIFKLVAEKE